MFRNVLILLFVLAAVFGVVRWTRRAKRLFEIRVSEHDVAVLGPIPNRSQAEVRAFVRTLRLPVGARLVGVEDGGDFRLICSRSIRQDDRAKVDAYLRGPDLTKLH